MYTSKELSKKLKDGGCELEGNKVFYMQFSHDTPTILYYKYDILNDICVKYAKEFFGEDEDFNRVETTTIFNLIKSNKIKEAEEYIWEHCLFNPKNKTLI